MKYDIWETRMWNRTPISVNVGIVHRSSPSPSYLFEDPLEKEVLVEV